MHLFLLLRISVMNRDSRKYFINVVILFVVSVTITVFLLPRGKINEFSNYKIGLLAPEKVVSPFDFEILRSDEELREVRSKIRSTVLPIFVYIDTLNLNLYRNYSKFYKDFDILREMNGNLSAIIEKRDFYSTKKDSLLKIDSLGFATKKSEIDSIFNLYQKDIKK